jgi:cytochrome c oxidase cbb3-type subunit III
MSDVQQTPEPYNDPLTDHEYDGIREFDNPIPGWWSWIFIGSIVFSVFYFGAYQLGTAGTSVAQEYESDNQALLSSMIDKMGELTVDEATILVSLGNNNHLLVGAGIFAQKCISCHGTDGEGLSGPNMTDDQYKNIKLLGDIGRVVENGVPATAMAGWKTSLHPNEIVMVSAYVASLRSKNVTGRAPEGETIPDWPTPPPVENTE